MRPLFSSIAGVLLCSTCAGQARAADALPSQEAQVLSQLHVLLDGLAKRDRQTMASVLLPGGSATLMRNGKPVQMGFDAFVDRLSAPGTDTREERIQHPLVRVDDNLAVVWTYYTFWLNGKLDHCGTDTVNLVKVEGRWLIASIGDTSRSVCPESASR